MRRARPLPQEDQQGQDSFLDVVANIVGILILLVMVVGVRAAREPETAVTASPRTPKVTPEEVEQAYARAIDARRETAQLARRAAAARREVAEQDADRVHLAAFVSSVEEDIERRKAAMGTDERRGLELRQKLGAAQLTLDRLAREQVALAALESPTEVVESLPTPLAQAVKGNEIHIRLAAGMAKVIPLDALLAEFKQDAENNVWRLQNRDFASGTIGPIEGFRLRYDLRKYQYSTPRGAGTLIRLVRWRLLPESERLGEPIAQALASNSELMLTMQEHPPAATTVTIWTYPDSFNEFRQLKKALYEQGYATAGRPLPRGVRIGGSPNGTRSAAQ